MCIAIPYGQRPIKESEFWYRIRTNPLYMLMFGAFIQSIVLAGFEWLVLHQVWLITEPVIPNVVIAMYGLLIISNFIFFALSMFFYAQKTALGDIEYLYYGAFFFLAQINIVFFYIVSFIHIKLLIGSLILQLALLFFNFKPLWRAWFWIDKRYNAKGLLINTIFSLLVLIQCLFLLYALFF
jgi:hypothetical protein